MTAAHITDTDGVSSIQLRVRYGETDQMGLAHHANYLVWCEEARTAHMRRLGVSYREMEEQGIRLPVVDARVRYRQGARYDDPIRVYCWVRDAASRRVEFGYAVVAEDDRRLLATAQTALVAVDSTHVLTTLPSHVRERLTPVPDPLRL
jgi:acyl-CoA thioester hydrolase